jgi:hypothetical protein
LGQGAEVSILGVVSQKLLSTQDAKYFRDTALETAIDPSAGTSGTRAELPKNSDS